MPGTFSPATAFKENRGLAIPACSTARAWPHVPWYMPGSLTHGGWENVPGIPGACATRNVTYLAKGPLPSKSSSGTDMIYMYLLVYLSFPLTHLHLAPHVCVNKIIIIGSDNGLSPDWHQVIIWTNAGILLIGPIGTNFSEILIRNQIFSLKNALKISSAKWRPFCPGGDELSHP